MASICKSKLLEDSKLLIQVDNSEVAAIVITNCLALNDDILLIHQDQSLGELDFDEFDQIILVEDLVLYQDYQLNYQLDNSRSKLSLFSSGSVKLKSITLEFNLLWQRAKQFIQFLNLDKSNYIQSLPLSSVAGFNLLLRALASKSSIVFPRKVKTADFANSTLSLVPTQLKLWSSEERILKKIAKAKLILIGGESIDLITEDLVREYQLPVIYTYAATELGGTVALRKPNQETFVALPGFTFSLNVEKKLVINQKFLTEDRVVVVSDTEIKDIARDSDWVNSGGYKFKLSQLNEKFNQVFSFQNLMIEKVKDDVFGDCLKAYFQGEITIQELEAWQNNNLPVYQQLKFVKLREWPVGHNFKTAVKLAKEDAILVKNESKFKK